MHSRMRARVSEFQKVLNRAKTEVAGYAFTTLNPVMAVIRVADDGSFEGSEGQVYEETWVEEQREKERDEG